YGSEISGSETRIRAIPLKPGNYSYGGTLYCLKGDKETGYDVAGQFFISKEGKL
ncbi:MAG: hypothetical protein GXP14_02075, partial [Gammaproteobacteria bacterium]|nr:hypothetical protein [Gammaproteobacteria bacterium]